MMFAISRGNIVECNSDTNRLIYFVTSLDRVQEADLSFVFSDGHATKAFTRIHDDPASLDKVDWPLMQEQYWSDTGEDPDRGRRRQKPSFLYTAAFPGKPWSIWQSKTPT